MFCTYVYIHMSVMQLHTSTIMMSSRPPQAQVEEEALADWSPDVFHRESGTEDRKTIGI